MDVALAVGSVVAGVDEDLGLSVCYEARCGEDESCCEKFEHVEIMPQGEDILQGLKRRFRGDDREGPSNPKLKH